MPTIKQDEALVVAWVKDFWHEHKVTIIVAAVAFVLGAVWF